MPDHDHDPDRAAARPPEDVEQVLLNEAIHGGDHVDTSGWPSLESYYADVEAGTVDPDAHVERFRAVSRHDDFKTLAEHRANASIPVVQTTEPYIEWWLKENSQRVADFIASLESAWARASDPEYTRLRSPAEWTFADWVLDCLRHPELTAIVRRFQITGSRTVETFLPVGVVSPTLTRGGGEYRLPASGIPDPDDEAVVVSIDPQFGPEEADRLLRDVVEEWADGHAGLDDLRTFFLEMSDSISQRREAQREQAE